MRRRDREEEEDSDPYRRYEVSTSPSGIGPALTHHCSTVSSTPGGAATSIFAPRDG